MRQELTYWQSQLRQSPALLELPTDYPRPVVQHYRQARETGCLPADLGRKLQRFNEQTGTTLLSTLLAAFKLLLYRYTQQTDIIVGSGFFDAAENTDTASILPLRSHLAGKLSFLDLLIEIQRTVKEARAHQDVTFSQLLAASGLEPAQSHAALFQTVLLLDSAVTERKQPEQGAEPDLVMLIRTEGAALEITAAYDATLFKAATIRRLLLHYQTVIESALNAPDQQLVSLPLMSETERRQILVDWNKTPAPLPPARGIHQLFELQTSRTPAATAVIYNGRRVSYEQLNRRANQLARYLRQLGAGTETLVGICMERSVDMIVALLATLKAGATYVPLDPTHPASRIEYILADAGIAILLSEEALLPVLPDHEVQIVSMDREQTKLALYEDTNLNVAFVPANLAYVIYTSGSTGRPKGVAISHSNAAAMLDWAGRAFTAEELKGVAAVTTICFDLSVYELFLPLSRGGAIILLPDALALPTSPDRQSVTLLNTVPSVMTELIRTGRLPDTILTVNLAGEPLKRVLVDQIYEFPHVERVYNLYGPSEDTTYSTYAAAARGVPEEPTIGRPIDHTQAYVLDKNLQPVPVGITGELYLGGSGVSRCYLNRPALTAEKYIPDPFSTTPGGRLYRTQDLARFRPDGEIEFLGRSDYQVKIRGYRIELGEIETALAHYPLVSEQAVLAREDEPGDKRLAAYVVAKAGAEITVSALRTFLGQTLPDYMIPTLFIFLDSMPLTPSGKIDRRALPAPTGKRPSLDTPYVAPRNAAEETVITCWQDILGWEQIGVHDNFLDLGGQSLRAMEIMTRLQVEFGVDIPLSLFFEYPTAAQLAQTIPDGRSDHGKLAPLSDRSKPIPLSFDQQRLWFLDQLVPDSPLYNIPVVLSVVGELNPEILAQCLTEIVRRHEALRTTFTEVDASPIQVIRPPEPVNLTVYDLRSLPEDRAQQIREEEACRPINLETGPLLRGALLQLKDDVNEIVLTVHHICFDGWSTAVLLEELKVLYADFSAGCEPQLPDLPLQYADYAIWQNQIFQEETLENHLGYWREQLKDEPAPLLLPADYPRPEKQTYRGRRVSLRLSRDLVSALQQLSRRENASLFMTMFAAFNVLLYRYTGQMDIVTGVPIANRTRPEIKSLIGFFVNTIPLRVNLSGSPTFLNLLARVRQAALGAFAHQEVPLEKLVEHLNPVRRPGYNLYFQVLFVMQNGAEEVVELPGLRITFAGEAHTLTAKFDLTVSVEFQEDDLIITAEYNTGLFDAATIERLLAHYRTLLEGAAADPEQPITILPLLAAAERRQLVSGWNDTHVSYTQNDGIHRLFEAQAAVTPKKTAVIFGNERLTYRELNHRANQLAHYLRRLGIRPDVRVGICLKRSLEMVTAVLGVLKAGGACVPMDPAYPAERLAFMLKDSEVPVLLVREQGSGRKLQMAANQSSSPDFQPIVVDLDADWSRIAQENTENIESEVPPDNLVYVIYTSGSTGRPKGVALSHGALNNLLAWQKENLPEPARTLQFASLSFDVSFQEMFSTWHSGGTLLLISEEMQRDTIALLRFLDDAAVERLFLPFVALHHLAVMASEVGIVPKGLRDVITAGEQLQISQAIVAFFQRLPHCRLHNHYGPSESHVVTAHTLTGPPDTWPRLPPIGRPIANTAIYLLDRYGQPVPIGVPGELYIGGANVARGYLARPGLTADRFVPSPFTDVSVFARLYKTGDLARIRPDGNIEYLGRIDQQVKVLGFRVEPGEIENVLSHHTAVREAIVIVQGDGPTERHLVAYIVLHPDGATTTEQLRHFLKQQLPDHMVPALFVFLDVLPLTPSGKINRRALPVPGDDIRLSFERPFVAPRNAAEQLMGDLWFDVLGIKEVSIYDNFFHIGGHSLKATQLNSRIRSQFDIDLPLTAIFEAPVLVDLVSTVLEQQANQVDGSTLDELLAEVEQLSDEELQALLAAEQDLTQGETSYNE